MGTVPATRIRPLNDGRIASQGRYVLYWMVANRRMGWNFALEVAAQHARVLRRPLLILEALRVDYEHASDRLHQFVLSGMEDNAESARIRGVRYHAYVEPARGAGRGLLTALADHACLVVTDDHPAFHYPAMLDAASRRVDVRLEAVDSNGLLPMRSADRAYPTAHAFRRHLQRELPQHLATLPARDPLRRLAELGRAVVPRDVLARWPSRTPMLADLPIDHGVGVIAERGGPHAGRRQLRRFVGASLSTYAERRTDLKEDTTSGLSPFLHFGHVGAHEILAAVTRHEGWAADFLSPRADGRRRGWWGMSESAEAFLDQLVTWRELSFNTCVHRPEAYATYESLPDWARRTLGKHASDPRSPVYGFETFEAATTHDELWNAAQRQLLREGRIHNYLRMLWGKKILEWSSSPEAALETMILLNDRYAGDGRDPNSYGGILWVMGRHDRPWGPERSVFGTVRYMSSENTRRKLRTQAYLDRFAAETRGGGHAPR